MREGDLDAAIGALDEGRERDRGYELRGRRADYHACSSPAVPGGR